MVDGMILNLRPDAEEQIPRERLGNGIVTAGHRRGQTRINAGLIPLQGVKRLDRRLGPRNTLRPIANGAVGPDVDFANLSNSARPYPFHGGAGVVHGAALVT